MMTAEQSEYILKSFLYRDSLVKALNKALKFQDSLCKKDILTITTELEKAKLKVELLQENNGTLIKLDNANGIKKTDMMMDYDDLEKKYKKETSWWRKTKRFLGQFGLGIFVGGGIVAYLTL